MTGPHGPFAGADLGETGETLQRLVQEAPIGIIGYDLEGRVFAWNPGAERILGWTAAEALGGPPPHVPAESMDEFRANHSRTLAGRGIETYTIRRRHKDGSEVRLELANSLVRDPAGRPIGVLSMLRDVTAEHAAQAALAEAELRYRTLVERMPMAAFVAAIDIGEPLLYMAPQYAAISGLDPEAMPGSFAEFMERVHPDDREALLEVTRRVRAEGGPVEVEYRLLRGDGGHGRVLERVVRVDAEDGSPLYVQGFIVDVTERWEAQQRAAELEAQLRHAQRMDAIGRLAGGVAHDFNNLLTVMQGHLSLAGLRFGDDPDLREVGRAVQRAAGLTQQLLAYGRRQVLQPAPTQLDAVVAAMETMLDRLLGADVEVVHRPAGALPPVHVDPGGLEQVIVNLAVNARDAMAAGGRLEFRTGLVEAGDARLPTSLAGERRRWVLLEVADTGSGIAPDVLPLVFEPFFTTKPVGEGTGLGLSTVYGIVTQSGGEVTVASEPGAGTTFSVFLPVHEGDPAPAAPAPAPAAQATAVQASPPAPAAEAAGTALLVEDEPAVRKLLADALALLGYRVLAAGDGDEALGLAAGTHVDVLVSDIVLPSLRGTEVLAELRRTRPALPAVLISGYSETALVGGVPPGAVFLAKPFSPDVLAQAVREVVGAAVRPATS